MDYNFKAGSLISWNSVAGPLAAQLYSLRTKEDSLFSLLDKDTIRIIILYVYPKPEEEEEEKLHVPLQFWFNQNPEFALPMIAHAEWGRRVNIIELTTSGDLHCPIYLNARMEGID